MPLVYPVACILLKKHIHLSHGSDFSIEHTGEQNKDTKTVARPCVYRSDDEDIVLVAAEI